MAGDKGQGHHVAIGGSILAVLWQDWHPGEKEHAPVEEQVKEGYNLGCGPVGGVEQKGEEGLW